MTSLKNGRNADAKPKAKIDPSFKSKRYRDKLRTEVKALESLIPVHRSALNRKLDSQTVYRLVIAYLEIKSYFKAIKFLSNENGGCPAADTEARKSTKIEHEKGGRLSPYGGKDQAETKMVDQPFQHIHFEPALDGFVLLLSVDGTVMYVSENICNHIGFNQVDLIHRCIYGILHPGDQSLVRDVLENHGDFSFQPAECRLAEPAKKPKKGPVQTDVIPVSFHCRMRSFTRKSPGYSTFHCIGKTNEALGMFRSKNSSPRVAILYCRPYLLDESEGPHQNTDDVIWSKHDLDLKFSAVEKREKGFLGFHDNELCGKSLYQLVHPDDLCLMVNMHITITEVNEVQSFYLRLQSKDGDWIWLHCKGKVISKNSKKFSVVFTHRPIRDEDSIFIEHETLLRRKCSASNLMTLSKPPSSTQNRNHTGFGFMQDSQSCSSMGMITGGPRGTTYTPAIGHCSTDNEIANIFGQAVFYTGKCPSTWHLNSGRHSPVVPSSQIAQKTAYKDKHIHPRLYERKFCPSQHTEPLYGNGSQNAWVPCGTDTCLNCQVFSNTDYIYPYKGIKNTSTSVVPIVNDCNGGQFRYFGNFLSKPYNYPPSPPPSPNTVSARHRNVYTSADTVNKMNSSRDLRTINHEGMDFSQWCTLPNSYLSVYTPHQHNSRIQSRASVKVSMVYNSDIKHNVNGCMDMCKAASTRPDMPSNGIQNQLSTQHAISLAQQTGRFKTDQNVYQSCAVTNDNPKKSDECRQYDIEASIHMKIVETQGNCEHSAGEVSLPDSASFMDYFTS